MLSVGEPADSVQAMRLLLVATGIAWAFRSVLEVFAPQYFHPVTPLDHLAVWAYTVALVLTAPCVIALGRMVPSFIVRVVSICAGVAAFAAGVSNVAEDAFGLPNAGNHYVAGFLVMLGAIVANAVVLAVLRYWRSVETTPLGCSSRTLRMSSAFPAVYASRSVACSVANVRFSSA